MRTALFPGSFDPFTSGHLNILTRALTIFDEVVVAIGVNQDKTGFYTVAQKTDIIAQATKGLKGVRIINYDGLTVDIERFVTELRAGAVIRYARFFATFYAVVRTDEYRHERHKPAYGGIGVGWNW